MAGRSCPGFVDRARLSDYATDLPPYYRARRRDVALRMRLRELAATRPRFGYRRLHILLRREGWRINAKKTYRLYREEGLRVRAKRP